MSTASDDRDPPPVWCLPEVAGWVSGAAPSCGPVRLVAIDGHAGSGKTTLAGRLSALCGDAPVVRLDDIARHDELFGWTSRFQRWVLSPLAAGESARYPVYDWVRRESSRHREVPPAAVVFVEGVGAGRRALRPYLTALLWLDLPRATAWDRGKSRDGPEQAEFWNTWIPEERAHFATDPTVAHARYLVRQSSTAVEGFTVLPGPAHPAYSSGGVEGDES